MTVDLLPDVLLTDVNPVNPAHYAEPLRRIKKDARLKLGDAISPERAAQLVRVYYQHQDIRKASGNQRRAAAAQSDERDAVDYVFGQMLATETEIRHILDAWTDRMEHSVWAKSVYGVGPVIAAGLASHINIERCPHPGHLYAFAGLAPTVKWLGTERSRALVNTVSRDTPADPDQWEPDEAALNEREYQELTAIIGAGDWNQEALGYQQLLAVSRLTHRGVGNLARLCRTKTGAVTRESIIRGLARRPWNADLKSLCAFKIGDSFIKFSASPKCYYGHLYQERKAIEVARNEAGEYAATAAAILAGDRAPGKTTTAYAAYSEGRLPAAHITARARRTVVKWFLDHYWRALYRSTYGREPVVQPYPIAHMGHTHFIPPPPVGYSRAELPSKEEEDAESQENR